MNPILFQLGPITLYSFGLLVALGFIVGTLWVMKRAKAAGHNVDLYLQAILWIILSGFIGARLLYVVYFPDMYWAEPQRILLDRGGLVWYGGLVTSIMAGVLFARLKKLPLPQFADIIMPPAALGLAIGRIGCFFSGCCYGRETDGPFGVHFPFFHETYPNAVYPTQLFESAALIVLIFLLNRVYKTSKTPGVTAAGFFIGYGVIRFVIEYFRGDVVYWVDNLLTASQVFSLIGILGGIITIFLLKNTPHRKTAQA